MPIPNNKRWRLYKAKQRAMLELVRLARAPVKEDDAGELLNDIRAYTAKLKLPQSDADWFYKKMQRDGWRFGGIPIDDWKVCVDSFFKAKYFPSLR